MSNLEFSERVIIYTDPNPAAQVGFQEDAGQSGSENLGLLLKNLSGAALSHHGKYLWLGTDEMTTIERFTRQEDAPHVFREHRQFYFRDFVPNFDEDQGEVDVEGLDFDQDRLWIIGSHSSKRKKVNVTVDKFQVSGKELKRIERQHNRYLLGCVSINAQGIIDPTQSFWLKRQGHNNALTHALAEDEYLNLSQCVKGSDQVPGQEFYLYLPSKENGLDLEGIAVDRNRLLIGCRGPVLRGIAILLEIQVKPDTKGKLKLKPMGAAQRSYHRHFLDLGGLGIRELCWEERGKSLLILAGPTMDLDGTHALFRLQNPFDLPDQSLSSLANQQLTYLGEIPHGHQCDRAEGIARYGDQALLVVYDKPADKPANPESQPDESSRLIYNDQGHVIGVYADLFTVGQ